MKSPLFSHFSIFSKNFSLVWNEALSRITTVFFVSFSLNASKQATTTSLSTEDLKLAGFRAEKAENTETAASEGRNPDGLPFRLPGVRNYGPGGRSQSCQSDLPAPLLFPQFSDLLLRLQTPPRSAGV